MERFRVRELQPFSSRKRYRAGATSNFGQVVPLTTMVLKKASGFQMPGMSEGPAGVPVPADIRSGEAVEEGAVCRVEERAVGVEGAVLDRNRDLADGRAVRRVEVRVAGAARAPVPEERRRSTPSKT